MKTDNNFAGARVSFGTTKIAFNVVRPLKRETLASAKLKQIFAHADDTLVMTRIDARNSVLKDASGKIYLKSNKFTEFVNDSMEVKDSKQAVKCFTRELMDAKGNLIKRVKRFYNSIGMYKVEVWDADGKTLINEVIGAATGQKLLNPSNTKKKQTFFKPVFNYPLKKGNPFEVIKYFKNAERPIERAVYNKDRNLEMIEIPKYKDGSLAEIQRLSKSRKLVQTLKVDTFRDYSKLSVINNSVGWQIYP